MVIVAPELNELPPLDAVYHLIEVPVATKFATVGLAPLQNACEAVPVGTAGKPVIFKLVP